MKKLAFLSILLICVFVFSPGPVHGESDLDAWCNDQGEVWSSGVCTVGDEGVRVTEPLTFPFWETLCIDSGGEVTIISWLAYNILATTAFTNADIDVSPGSAGYGDVEIGSSSTQIVSVSNLGSGSPLGVGDISLAAHGSDFSITSSHVTPTDLAQEDSVNIEVIFSPTAPGQVSNILRIMTDHPDESVTDVPINGTGIELVVQTLALTPDPLNITPNASAIMTVSLSQPSPPGGVDVVLSMSPGVAASAPSSVHVFAGAMNQNFEVTGSGVSGTEVLSASAGGFSGDSANINVNPLRIFMPLVTVDSAKNNAKVAADGILTQKVECRRENAGPCRHGRRGSA